MRIGTALAFALSTALLPANSGHSGQGSAQQAASLDALTAAEWRDDLWQFADQLVRTHRSPFHQTTRERFADAIAELDRALPSLAPHEAAVGFLRLGALIGDTHSRVGAPQLKVVPITVEWFADELRVVRASPEVGQLLGARVLRIGTVDVHEAFRRVAAVIAQGVNEPFARLFSPSFLVNVEVLHALRVSGDRHRLEFLVDNGKGPEPVTLEATVTAGQASIARGWTAYVPKGGDQPLYRRDREKNWMTHLEKGNLAYCAFNRYADDETMKTFSEELDRLLRANRPRRLVIDMRNNPGGDFNLGRWYLVRKVLQFPHLLTRGRLFVATGRGTFSAAFINALDFRRDASALLVGEPPGERGWAYSDPTCNRLPHSSLLAYFSTRFYRETDEDVAAIQMDANIAPTWEDLAAGRDAVLDWILAQPDPADPLPLRWP